MAFVGKKAKRSGILGDELKSIYMFNLVYANLISTPFARQDFKYWFGSVHYYTHSMHVSLHPSLNLFESLYLSALLVCTHHGVPSSFQTFSRIYTGLLIVLANI